MAYDVAAVRVALAFAFGAASRHGHGLEARFQFRVDDGAGERGEKARRRRGVLRLVLRVMMKRAQHRHVERREAIEKGLPIADREHGADLDHHVHRGLVTLDEARDVRCAAMDQRDRAMPARFDRGDQRVDVRQIPLLIRGHAHRQADGVARCVSAVGDAGMRARRIRVSLPRLELVERVEQLRRPRVIEAGRSLGGHVRALGRSPRRRSAAATARRCAAATQPQARCSPSARAVITSTCLCLCRCLLPVARRRRPARTPPDRSRADRRCRAASPRPTSIGRSPSAR